MPLQGALKRDDGSFAKVALGVAVVGAGVAVYFVAKKWRENKSCGTSGKKSDGSAGTDKATTPKASADTPTPVKPVLPPPTASSTPAPVRPTVPPPSNPSVVPPNKPLETPGNQVLRDGSRQPATPLAPVNPAASLVPGPTTPLRDPQAPRPREEDTRSQGAPDPGAWTLRDAPTTKPTTTSGAPSSESRSPMGGANAFNSSFDSSRMSPVFGGQPTTRLSDHDPKLSEFNPATSHPAFYGFKFDGPPL
jgi:hypothetical protein